MLALMWLIGCQSLAPGYSWVVTPKRLLPQGTVIASTDLQNTVVPDALVTPDTVAQSNQLVGRVAKTQLIADAVIVAQQLLPQAAGAGASAFVTDDTKLVVLDWWVAPLQPGDVVDIITQGQSPCVLSGPSQVVAVKVDGSRRSTTLLVPEQTEDLTKRGRRALIFALRNPTDLAPTSPTCVNATSADAKTP